MKQTAIAILLLSSLLVSCKKENRTSSTAATTTITQIVKSQTGPDYNANPYDNYGVLHNQGLAYVLENPGVDDMTDNELINYTNEWGYSVFHVYEPNLIDRVFDFLEDQPNNYANEINNTTHSEIVKTHLHNLANLIIDEIYEDLTAVSYAEYKDKIITFENGIINDPALMASQKEIILGSASIARYSMYYGWQHSEPIPPQTMAMSKAKKLAIAACADASNFSHSWSLTEAAATSVWVYRHLP